MGKVRETFERLKRNILSFRIRLQESNIRASVEKKLMLEEKLARIEMGERSVGACANAEARRRILNTCEKMNESGGDELTYRYRKLKDSAAYVSVKNIFKLPRRFMLVSRLTRYISLLLTIIETSAFALAFVILLALSLPFTVIGYIVYWLIGRRRFERYAEQISKQSESGIVILMYSTRDKRRIKNTDASLYAEDGKAVLKIDLDPSFGMMNVGIDHHRCYYGRPRFKEYLEKKNMIKTSDITVIRL